MDSSTPIRIKQAERRRQDKEAKKSAEKEQMSCHKKGKKICELSKEEQDNLKTIEEELRREMKGLTWRSLEVGRKFDQDKKIDMITDDTLVLGVDVASEAVRADTSCLRIREIQGHGQDQ